MMKKADDKVKDRFISACQDCPYKCNQKQKCKALEPCGGECEECGLKEKVEHCFPPDEDVCSRCRKPCHHEWNAEEGVCGICRKRCRHEWVEVGDARLGWRCN